VHHVALYFITSAIVHLYVQTEFGRGLDQPLEQRVPTCHQSVQMAWPDLCMRLRMSLSHSGFALANNSPPLPSPPLLSPPLPSPPFPHVQAVPVGRTLHELTFTDAPELKECYLHNLAAAPSLTLFKCVLLAASPQVWIPLGPLTAVQRFRCHMTLLSFSHCAFVFDGLHDCCSAL